MRQNEAIVVHDPDLRDHTVEISMIGWVYGEDAIGSITVTTNSTYVRLLAKKLVDAADKMDIEAFVEAGAPLQRSDCE